MELRPFLFIWIWTFVPRSISGRQETQKTWTTSPKISIDSFPTMKCSCPKGGMGMYSHWTPLWPLHVLFMVHVSKNGHQFHLSDHCMHHDGSSNGHWLHQFDHCIHVSFMSTKVAIDFTTLITSCLFTVSIIHVNKNGHWLYHSDHYMYHSCQQMWSLALPALITVHIIYVQKQFIDFISLITVYIIHVNKTSGWSYHPDHSVH